MLDDADFDIGSLRVKSYARPGKLVVGGFSRRADVLLARFNANGSRDTSFGANGIVRTDFGIGDAANTLVLQPDGKLVAAGSSGRFGQD